MKMPGGGGNSVKFLVGVCRQDLQIQNQFQTKIFKTYTCFQTKMAYKHHTFWGGTYLYTL